MKTKAGKLILAVLVMFYLSFSINTCPALAGTVENRTEKKQPEELRVRTYLMRQFGVPNEYIRWDESKGKITVYGVSLEIEGLKLQNGVGFAQAAKIEAAYKRAFDIRADEKVIYGFTLIDTTPLPETGSAAMLFYHNKSGARLLYLKNEDTEKTFGISFTTPAEDNTGVNHIIEHSVLDGSRGYPVKSPFLEMEKRSLKTFLNAMTFPDFTLYPVASRNDKDFRNLMSVYLDAVFFPLIYEQPNIFKQEGWRCELNSPMDIPVLNGVVYNEMKGVYSSPRALLEHSINQSLFPETCYRWDSGGVPEDILTLTEDRFLETHRKYYLPSNSLLFLYGKLDMEDSLKFIHDNYLSKFVREKTNAGIMLQKPLGKRAVMEAPYPVSREAPVENKAIMALNFVTGQKRDKELDLGMSLLSGLLMGTESSPLKKALLENKLAESVSYTYNNYMLQPVFSIVLENTDERKRDRFEKVVENTLDRLAQEGFNRELVQSQFNYYELAYRMSKTSLSRGIGLNILSVQGWIYGNNPYLYLETEETLARIKDSMDEGYFESLIREYLVDSKHSSIVVLKPARGLEEIKTGELELRLESWKTSMEESEPAKLVRQTKEFKSWQEKPDSREALARIPQLTLRDLGTPVEKVNTAVEKKGEVDMIFNRSDTHGVSYMGLYFDASRVPQDKLPYLTLLTQLLGRLDTEKYSYSKLSDEIMMNTGGMTFNISPFAKYKNPDQYRPRLTVTFAALEDNTGRAMELLEEILHHSLFEDRNRFREILEQTKTELEASFLENPRKSISTGVLANLSESGKYKDALSGPGYYKFLSKLYNHLEENWEEAAASLKEVSKLVFARDKLVIGYTGSDEGYRSFADGVNALMGTLESSSAEEQQYSFNPRSKKQGFTLPVKTLDVMKGGNYNRAGFEYSGKMKVLQKVLNSEYLWQKIRVQGGAYGGMVSISEDGSIVFLSYRDPNLIETLDAFDGAVEFLKNFTADQERMTQYIIGSIGELERNFTPQTLTAYGTVKYLTGITDEDLDRERKEILSTTVEDIRSYAAMLEKVLKQGIYYAAGDETKINRQKELFQDIHAVIN